MALLKLVGSAYDKEEYLADCSMSMNLFILRVSLWEVRWKIYIFVIFNESYPHKNTKIKIYLKTVAKIFHKHRQLNLFKNSLG